MKKITKTCEICGRKVTAEGFLFEKTKPSSMCIIMNDSGVEHIKIQRKKLYDSIPQEKKQAFLDNFWKGMTVGESYKAADLTQEEGFAVLDENIEQKSYLRTDAK